MILRANQSVFSLRALGCQSSRGIFGHRRQVASCLLMAVLCISVLGRPIYGQEGPIEAAEVVKKSASSRWYDREENDFVLPDVKQEIDHPLRTEGWIAEKANADARQEALNDQTNGGTAWGGWNGINSEVFSSVIVGVLGAVLLVAIILLLYHSLKNYVPMHWQRKQKEKKIEIDPARAEDLPFEATQEAYENPLAAAEAFYRSGDYNSAIVLVYGYMLLVLDQGRYIDLQKGKTNRMYLREVKGNVTLKDILAEAMLGFEDAYFGQIRLPKERFEHIWQKVSQFEEIAASRRSEQAPAVPRAEVVAQ